MDAMLERKLPQRGSRPVASGLRAAEDICRERGLRFTENRMLVMEFLLRSEQPVTAYELIRMLQKRLGRRLSPPTVYRAVEFLLQQGLASRIETRNAFVPSMHLASDQPCAFFICETCGSLAEVENAKLETLFRRDAASLGFRIGKRVIELQGTCASCLATEASAD